MLLRSRLHQHEVFTTKREGLNATDGASFQLRRHGFRQDKDETQQYSRLETSSAVAPVAGIASTTETLNPINGNPSTASIDLNTRMI